MKGMIPRHADGRPLYHGSTGLAAGAATLCLATFFTSAPGVTAAEPGPKPGSTWPQAYSVQEDNGAGALVLSTPYYTVEHDLKKGGAITRFRLTHGHAANLLVRPIESRLLDAEGAVLTDLKDATPKVTRRQAGLNEIVTVECALADQEGRASGVRVKSTFEYRWGYVKVHREFFVPAGGVRVREVCPFSTILAPSMTDYGYREGLTEEERAPAFNFGSNRWGKLRPGQAGDKPV